MKRPVRVHDVQKLTGCLAALSRFISRLGEKALPLYRLMKKSDKFEWTPPSRCLLPQSAKSLCRFTLQPQGKLSAQYLRSSGKKKERPSEFSAQSIMCLKF